LGPEVVKGLRFICSDMCSPTCRSWPRRRAKPCMWWIASTSLHLNQRSTRCGGGRAGRLRAEGAGAAGAIKKMRWPLLRRGSRVRGRARQKLNVLLASKLQDRPGLGVEETFSHVWTTNSVTWAAAFLDYWCYRAMASRLEPMKKVARMLRTHEKLLLNWFRRKARFPVARLRA